MKDRYSIFCAVFLILTKKEENTTQILLQKRQNTGILDGLYDVACSGHLEAGETLKNAMVREAKEEIGITINEKDLNLITTIHTNFDGVEYLLITFDTDNYTGTPKIMEPEKCSDLSWFDINNLPKNIADTRKIMIEDYLNKKNYDEYGFE